ncbi:hypothetical protein LTT66_27285 [Nocardia gipuzkoensis]|uniref:hypothetical protein n=1 Tax=Nocardia gipuzkoensis TaxID=2749991 RepID=UPI001E2A71DD|nr:hypothetical protein [Nocardia gipuzkoensis]UGT66925.1 hypothetical protein LTT66_27285 [Nocardia gipuzkoensis]
MAATLSELTLRARALEAGATAGERALDEQGEVLNELAALTRKTLDSIGRIDRRAETIGEAVGELHRDVGALRENVGELNRRVTVLEQGQVRLEQGQAALARGQAQLEQGQARLEQGMAQVLARLDKLAGDA